MKKITLEEKSAGGVVYRTIGELGGLDNQGIGKSEKSFEFLIGKHSGYHKWVLPKGLVEKGESDQEAAVREVEEEVGVQAEIVGMSPIKIIEYDYFAEFGKEQGKGANGEQTVRRIKTYQESGKGKTRVHKQVIFYLMEQQKDLGKAGWEMEERQWVSYETGIKLLDFETEREVLAIAGKIVGASGQNCHPEDDRPWAET